MYVYQFDIAAIILSVMLMILLIFRHGYPSAMHRLFIIMLVCCFISSTADLASAFTIMYPESVPLWLNYLVSIIYASTYLSIAMVFFLYVLEAARKLFTEKMFRSLRHAGNIGLILGVLLIATTPFTHMIFYFDGNLEYNLGSLVFLPYMFALAAFIMTILFLMRGRHVFEPFQRYVISVFLVLELAAVFIEIAFQYLLIGRFVAAVFLVLIYVVLENPTDYQYPGSRFYNRVAFENRVERLMSQDSAFSVIAFRMDSFAYINSVFDDETISDFVDILHALLCKSFEASNLFRLHTNICAIVTPASNEEHAVSVVRGDGRKRLMLGGLSVDVAEAICVVRIPSFIESVDDISRVVDAELSDNRAVLAERVVYAQQDVLEQVKHERRVSYAVQNAIDNLDIEVYYQPVYEFKTKRFCYAEALVRVRDKKFGAIPSDELIAAAEKNGAIIGLGNLVFSRVCRDIAAGRFNELGLAGVSVNLSMVECMQPNLADEVIRTLAAYGVRPDQVSFEITETVFAENSQTVVDNIEKLMNYGVRFSLDDFGSGFSSITYLMNMPVQNVKIGRLVVKRALEDKSYSGMLKKLIKVIKGMDRQVTIEGVETQEMVEYLATTKADYCQGYYYSEPLALRDFVAMMREHNSLIDVVDRVTDQAADRASVQGSSDVPVPQEEEIAVQADAVVTQLVAELLSAPLGGADSFDSDARPAFVAEEASDFDAVADAVVARLAGAIELDESAETGEPVELAELAEPAEPAELAPNEDAEDAEGEPTLAGASDPVLEEEVQSE